MSVPSGDPKSEIVRDLLDALERRLTKGVFGQIGIMIDVKDGSALAWEIVEKRRRKPGDDTAT